MCAIKNGDEIRCDFPSQLCPLVIYLVEKSSRFGSIRALVVPLLVVNRTLYPARTSLGATWGSLGQREKRIAGWASPFSACHQRLSFRALGTIRHHSAPRKPVSARVVSTHPAFSAVFAFVFFSRWDGPSHAPERWLSFGGACKVSQVTALVIVRILVVGSLNLVFEILRFSDLFTDRPLPHS